MYFTTKYDFSLYGKELHEEPQKTMIGTSFSDAELVSSEL